MITIKVDTHSRNTDDIGIGGYSSAALPVRISERQLARNGDDADSGEAEGEGASDDEAAGPGLHRRRPGAGTQQQQNCAKSSLKDLKGFKSLGFTEIGGATKSIWNFEMKHV